jgi:hypothetical protein
MDGGRIEGADPIPVVLRSHNMACTHKLGRPCNRFLVQKSREHIRQPLWREVLFREVVRERFFVHGLRRESSTDT